MQAVTAIFFDFLKELQFNDLRLFRPVCAQKKVVEGQKNAEKNARKAPGPDASALRVHRNLEKSLAKFLKCTKKTKKITMQRKFPRQNTQVFFLAAAEVAVGAARRSTRSADAPETQVTPHDKKISCIMKTQKKARPGTSPRRAYGWRVLG